MTSDADVLAPAALMARAVEVTGAEEWGDPAFLEPLHLLLDSCQGTGNLSGSGRRVLRSVLLRHLRNRLYVQAYVRRHPETKRRDLGAPAVVTGLPRTGTTLLHNLLAQDPRHRVLRLWEALHPVPAGDDGGLDETTLVAQAETWLERFYELVPDFRVVHPLTARGPEECDALLQNAFVSQHFDDMFDAPAYSRWFYGSPMHAAYAFYALQLRALQHGPAAAARWVLKSPGHLAHLDALLHVLPDALVVVCHREPTEALASYASLIRTVRTPNVVSVAPEDAGEQALQRCATAMRRALAARSSLGEDHFLDVSYPALVRDPVGTVAGIYRRLGTALSPGDEDRMRRWLARHPQGRYGPHRYEPQTLGLSRARVDSAFSDYRERFETLLAA